jgi:hypothetical protein
MQFVTVEVCAMRTLPAASTVECQSAIANPVATNKPAILPGRMMHVLS